jgi:hypothetical protein
MASPQASPTVVSHWYNFCADRPHSFSDFVKGSEMEVNLRLLPGKKKLGKERHCFADDWTIS